MSDLHRHIASLAITLGAALSCAGMPAAAQTLQTPAFSDPPQTRSSSFAYDEATGLLKSEKIEPDNPALCVETTYSFDDYGNRKQTRTAGCTEPNDFSPRTATAVYNAAAQPAAALAGSYAATVSNALGHSETKVVDPRFGLATSVTGPNGLTTTWELDAFGRKVKETRPDGSFSQMWYCYIGIIDKASNSAGCPTPTEAAPPNAMSFLHTQSYAVDGSVNGAWTRVYQDKRGRTIRSVTQAFDGGDGTTTGKLIVSDTFYNQNGAAFVTTQPYFLHTLSSTINGGQFGYTYTVFDVLGRPKKIYTADGAGKVTLDPASDDGKAIVALGSGLSTALTFSVVSYDYDGAKTTVTRADAAGNLLSDIQWRDPQGHVVLAQDAASAQTAFLYDAQGSLVTTVDPLGNKVELRYDLRGRKTQMLDPNKGLWTYAYNALGELVSQQSPNQRAAGTSSTLKYDELGRVIEKGGPEFTIKYFYDTVTGLANGAACLDTSAPIAGQAAVSTKGKLCGTSTTHGVTRASLYDRSLRAVKQTTTINPDPRYAQKTFVQRMAYDTNFGRLLSQTFDTGVSVQYAYTAGLGALNSVGTASGYKYWAAQRINAWGKSEDSILGHGVSNHARFDPLSGRVLDAAAGQGTDVGSATAMNVFKHKYVWDTLGNLSSRVDANGDGVDRATMETFSYDKLNRLTGYQVSNASGVAQNVTLAYNAIGNILFKSDVGSYVYPASGQRLPHAVTMIRPRAGGPTYSADYEYDAQGNLTRALGDARYRSIRYNSFNLPQGDDASPGLVGASTNGAAPTYDWVYNESEQRMVELRKTSRGTRTTWYLHPDGANGLSFEQETDEAGVTTNRHYIGAGEATALVTTTSAAPTTVAKLEYWHKDHLGSTVAVSVASANQLSMVKVVRYAYDPWGKRRNVNGVPDTANALVGDYHGGAPDAVNGTDRGFTGHEHLDDIGVINMNARLYDPMIGRFMQGDPIVGDPFDVQAYNAYSYAYNRPLNTVDADGKCPICAAVIVGALVARATGIIDQQQMRMVVSIAVAVWLGPKAGEITWAAAGQAAAAGFVSGAIATGSMQGAVQGGFTSVAFYGAGSLGQTVSNTAATAGMSDAAAFWSDSGLGRTILHAGVGCITTVAGGGRCGSGALSAGASQYLGARLYVGDRVGDTFVHALIGGTSSVLGGGKFAVGAQSGAFGYLFNQVAHDERPPQPGAPIPIPGDPRPIIDLFTAIGNIFSGPSYSETYRERALKAAGVDKSEAQNLDVHHIVMREGTAASPARVALAKVGIGVDDLENLIILSKSDHRPLHSAQYITAVNAVIPAAAAGSDLVQARAAVVLQLNLIKTSLYVKGTFP